MNEDKATRYHRLRRRADLLALGAVGSVLAGLVASGAVFRLREVSAVLGELLPGIEGDAATVVVMATVLFLLVQALELPFAWYQGFSLEHRYGLATVSARHWIADHLKGAALSVAFGVAAASAVYALLRATPDWWWAWAALLAFVALVAVTQLAPVVLLPLFYRFTPLDRPALAARLHALGARTRLPVAGVYEWQVSGHTRKANAALAGLGRTRRILLSDTLLAGYSDDEIEVVLAHELSHHVHHDLWRMMALQAVMIAGGFLAAHAVLGTWAEAIGLRGAADPAGLALLLLVAGAWAGAWLPILNAASRAHERRADRFALELTRNPAAFISAMRRLGQQNMAEDDPPPLAAWLFHSHPTVRARIQAALTWEAR
ncbi:MAG: M48 family metalloprotease [Vicinamibacterales bacterium]|nr:M48 family metalloprotease [Vicinamibacterales bacterium]